MCVVIVIVSQDFFILVLCCHSLYKFFTDCDEFRSMLIQQIHVGRATGRMAATATNATNIIPATSILVIDNIHIRNPDGCIAPTTLGK